MEIERWKHSCSSLSPKKGNKENLLKMEIERNTLRRLAELMLWMGNKENLLKMEIERHTLITLPILPKSTKQRKSPENGDWKSHNVETSVWTSSETKKISWKWRLKVTIPFSASLLSNSRNKENLLKMEIERFVCYPGIPDRVRV